MMLIQMAVLAVVALILGLFVVRPILTGSARAALPGAEGGALALPSGGAVLDGEIDDGDEGFAPLADLGSGEGFGGGFGGMGMVDFDSPVAEDPVDRLRGLIEQRKSETVEILRSWLDEKEEAQ
jgi:flagellar M-ring protein FliF